MNLLQLIYEAAADPKQWPVFLKHFGEIVGSPAVAFIAHDLNNHGATISARLGFDPLWVRAYEEYYASRNIWVQRGAHLLRPGGVWSGSDLVPDQELAKSEFYNDFLQPQNHFYTFGGRVMQEDSVISSLTAVRSKTAGPFEEREFALLRNLLPHLRTAVQLRQRVAMLETQLGNATRTLDHFQQGVFIVDGAGRVLMMNKGAEELLRAGDGLLLTRDGLRTARACETSGLRDLIAAAAKTTSGNGTHEGGAMSMSRVNGRGPLRALVAPLAPSSGNVKGRSAAVLFVTAPEKMQTPDCGVLAQLFGFTPAEARLAVALVQGRTPQEFADEAGVTLNTTRTHLKRTPKPV